MSRIWGVPPPPPPPPLASRWLIPASVMFVPRSSIWAFTDSNSSVIWQTQVKMDRLQELVNWLDPPPGSGEDLHTRQGWWSSNFSKITLKAHANGRNKSRHYCVLLPWGFLANNVASVCMGLKVWPVPNYTRQVPTLLWFHANGRNMLDPTMLRVVGQQCCVRLHGP